MQPSHIYVTIDEKSHSVFSEGATLESAHVTQELNQHTQCRIRLRQSSDRRFPSEDALGKSLRVTAIDDSGGASLLFDGFVLESKLHHETQGAYVATLTGISRTYLMDLTPRYEFWADKDLGTIAREMADQVGITPGMIAFAQPERPWMYRQWAETDFRFLVGLADDHGCWVNPTPEGFNIHYTFQDGPTLEWRGQGHLLSFTISGKLGQPAMNGAHYFPTDSESALFTDVSEEPEFYSSGQRMIDAVKARSREMLPPGFIHDRGRAGNLDAFENVLKKESVRAIGSKINGSGTSRSHEVAPGKIVRIQGEMDSDGEYGVTQVVHRYQRGVGYRNRFRCTPWKDFTNAEAPPRKRWYGVAPARVTHVEDPQGMGLLGIKFFWQKADDYAVLARLMTPHAGPSRGFYFIPEIGDEVSVVFEDGDLERPMVVGSLWNGAQRPPLDDFWGEEYSNNDCKRIVTKSGNRLQMIDKENKESVVLATPSKNKLTLHESSNENGRPSIMLHSDGDIFLSAGGRIHMKSSTYSREVG